MIYQLHIAHCQSNEAEQISENLEEWGALSITLTDKYDVPVFEPELGTMPLWPDVVINALYQDQEIAKQALHLLNLQYSHLEASIDEVIQEDWERTCIKDVVPQRFGHSLWVCPSWIEPPDPEAINLMLDPGLAFGTGAHPTTSLCLTWLDQAQLNNKTLVDYGCGSGILALAALKLGAKQVYAVDIDEQALQSTLNNATTNNIKSSQLHVDFPDHLQVKADIIIANILLRPLISLQTVFKTLLKPGSTLVVSGILAEQTSSLIKEYQSDFHHQSTKSKEGWSLLVFIRQ